MCAARKQDEDGFFAITGEGRAVALFRLVLAFMLVVMLAFVVVEGWRIWRDYRHAFINAENMVTNLARPRRSMPKTPSARSTQLPRRWPSAWKATASSTSTGRVCIPCWCSRKASCRSCTGCSCMARMAAGS